MLKSENPVLKWKHIIIVQESPQRLFAHTCSYLNNVLPYHCRAISKLLGERWRELSEEKREEYSRMAKEMADERMKVNPDCWKRKHRKDKDGGSKSSSGDGESPDCKKIK